MANGICQPRSSPRSSLKARRASNVPPLQRKGLGNMARHSRLYMACPARLTRHLHRFSPSFPPATAPVSPYPPPPSHRARRCSPPSSYQDRLGRRAGHQTCRCCRAKGWATWPDTRACIQNALRALPATYTTPRPPLLACRHRYQGRSPRRPAHRYAIAFARSRYLAICRCASCPSP